MESTLAKLTEWVNKHTETLAKLSLSDRVSDKVQNIHKVHSETNDISTKSTHATIAINKIKRYIVRQNDKLPQ